LRAHWADRRSTAVVDLRYEGGRTFLRVDRAEEGSYRVSTSRHGRHVVSADGSGIWSALPAGAPARWQRLLFAQPLPLAAALRGLELFHAAAVSVGDEAIAIVAPSGTGKSSVTAHMVAAGAGFVTDDVLAVDAVDGELVVYPGPARLAVTAPELRAVPPGSRSRLGPIVGRTDKLLAAPPPAGGPRRLARVALLSRLPGHGRLRISRSDVPSLQRLLGSAFLPHLATPERLLQRLDVCGLIAQELECYDVQIPTRARAADVAAALHTAVERG
jgi:hypothetical protein